MALVWKNGVVVACLLFTGGVAVAGEVSTPVGQSGIASVYSYKGGRTASGERMNPSGLIAAHRSLRFGTLVKVTNRRNGRTVVVRIIDRGPFVRGRVIDLSPAAANALGFSGLAPVNLAVLGSKA
jgi:rare lipoprotein A